jgi:hypothetical protein
MSTSSTMMLALDRIAAITAHTTVRHGSEANAGLGQTAFGDPAEVLEAIKVGQVTLLPAYL